MTRFLSRASLRRDAPIAALARLLMPDEDGARTGVAHRLIWTLFADAPERRRDFLWREMPADGAALGKRFIILSERPPADAHHLFELETKPFEPALRAGDSLAFSLRANPTVARHRENGRPWRSDVVMDALRATPPGPERAAAREAAITTAGRSWLDGQAERAGFRLASGEGDASALAIDGYERLVVDARRRIAVSVVEFDGVLTVTDPEPFLARLFSGYGKARAFGCGLMLIRRA